MAKGNLFLGTGSGKVGDVVLYRFEGKQCSRVRVREIKNPKSEGQQAQRAICSTVANAYSFLQPICNHSFENVQYEGKSMNFFLKRNMRRVRNALATYQNVSKFSGSEIQEGNCIFLNAPSTNAFILNPYQIAKGSLQNLVTIDCSTGYGPHIAWQTPSSTGAWTFQQWLENNGLSDPYSMLTVVYIKHTSEILFAVTDSEDETQTVGYHPTIYGATLHYWRLYRNGSSLSADDYPILERTDLSTDDQADLKEFVNAYFDMDVTVSNAHEVLSWGLESGYSSVYPEGASLTDTPSDIYENIVAAAIIRSQYDDGEWKRSNATLQLTGQNEANSKLLYYYGLDPYTGLQVWNQGVEEIGNSVYILNGSSSSSNSSSSSSDTEEDSSSSSTDTDEETDNSSSDTNSGTITDSDTDD